MRKLARACDTLADEENRQRTCRQRNHLDIAFKYTSSAIECWEDSNMVSISLHVLQRASTHSSRQTCKQ